MQRLVFIDLHINTVVGLDLFYLFYVYEYMAHMYLYVLHVSLVPKKVRRGHRIP